MQSAVCTPCHHQQIFFSTLLFPYLCTGRLMFVASITQTPLSSGFGLDLPIKRHHQQIAEQKEKEVKVFLSCCFPFYFDIISLATTLLSDRSPLQFLLDSGNAISSLYSLRLKNGNSILFLIVSAYLNIPCSVFFFLNGLAHTYVSSLSIKVFVLYTI